jgi:hypothetical protein
LSPGVVVFAHTFVVASGSRSRCRGRPVSGRAAEAGFERSVVEVVPDPGRAGSGGDPGRNDVGAQGGRGKNVEVPLPAAIGQAGPVGEAGGRPLAIDRSVYWRTLRRARMASQVSMPQFYAAYLMTPRHGSKT